MISLPKLYLLSSLLCLNACVSLLPDTGESPKRIWLNPALISSPLRHHTQISQTVAISEPTAANMLNSERLRIRDLTEKITFVDQIAGVEWQDQLPIMVQSHLIQALIQSKKFKAVGSERDSFKREAILETDIQTFDIIISKDKLYAEVQLSAKLLESKGRNVLWQKGFKAQSPIQSHALEAFISSLTKAYEVVLYEITQAVN